MIVYQRLSCMPVTSELIVELIAFYLKSFLHRKEVE